jgi:6,7-dimethyl-8-ribityllumazine synthase
MDKREFQGKLDAKGKRFGLIVSRFNELLSKQLLGGATDCLDRHGAKSADIFWVAGAYEIPAIARRLATSNRYDGVVALGAVIHGDTPHAEYINTEVSKGLSKVYYDTGVPTTFGVITADTLEQALERAGSKSGNKGWSAALAAIEMVNLESSIQ